MSDRADITELAVLASLEGMGPRRLAKLLAMGSLHEVTERILTGSVPADIVDSAVWASWKRELGGFDVDAMAERISAGNIRGSFSQQSGHPAALANDIDPAPVLFWRGELPSPVLPHVAIVGTRRCSGSGKEVAFELGAGLARAGVCVVSGLALGVDGAAHLGAVSVDGAPPLAIVGGGPDVVYPRRHARLFDTVAARGAVAAEAPPGAEPRPWRFPARNRLIAAFADLVVVVESRAAGGSLLTVEEALRRGIDVMAVPGSTRNPAAAGTNQLLVDGCAPIRGVDDVLLALGLDQVSARARRAGEPTLPRGDAADVLVAIDDGPTSTDEIIERSGLPLRRVLTQLELLVADGSIVADGAKVRRS